MSGWMTPFHRPWLGPATPLPAGEPENAAPGASQPPLSPVAAASARQGPSAQARGPGPVSQPASLRAERAAGPGSPPGGAALLRAAAVLCKPRLFN